MARFEYPDLSSKEQASILRFQRAILESVARSDDTKSIIDLVCRLEEQLLPNSVASVMLLEENGQALKVYAAPSMALEGIARLNNLRPGPGAGSCGNAVFRKKPQYVMNTFKDPRWLDLRQIAYDFNICSCWSIPICFATGQVIGTFALSSFEHRSPTKFHRKLLEIGASIISIVFNRNKTEEELTGSRRLLQLIIENAPICVFWKDRESRYLGCNSQFASDAGFSRPEELLGKTDFEMGWRDQAELYRADDRTVMASGEPKLEFEEPQTTPDGQRVWLRTSKVPLRNADGQVFGILGIYNDITERKEAEEELRIAAATFQSHEAIMITDANARIIRVNPAFEDITGYTSAEVIGKKPSILKSGQHDAAFYHAMWTSLAETGKWTGELWDRRKSGEIYPKFMNITAVYDDNRHLTNYVALFSDITHRKQFEAEIHQLAFYDPLTHLPNRRMLLDRLHHAEMGSSRHGWHGALLMLDLDHFKTINDTLGHVQGDQLLVAVAERLKSCLRLEDTVGRLGGDEFVVILEQLSSLLEEAVTQAKLIAEKILASLGRAYLLGRHECHSTPSIGICLFSGHRDSVEDLLRYADLALYQAKSAGRNTICFFDPAMQAAAEQRSSLEADLRRALIGQQLRLYYQIQVDSLSHPLGAEAVLRWEHPERGLVGPDQFIYLAEETGLIVPIGMWVLETATAQIKAWETNPETCGLTLSVNVSARQFRETGFAPAVQKLLKAKSANPSRLKLELTESIVMDNIDDSITKMNTLRELGVEFAMDDFGTGHSSLSNLKRLPLSEVKIDRSFVRDIAIDPNDAAIVNTIIAMSQTLGLNVIAEGVETKDQYEFLRRHGCPAFQGCLFGDPVPVDRLEETIRAFSRK